MSSNKIINVNELINQYKLIHGENAFDYSEFVYVNAKTPTIVICKKCGNKIEICPDAHKRCGCPQCAGNKKLNKEIFVQRAYIVWGTERFDYSEFIYINYRTPSTIICLTCNKKFARAGIDHIDQKCGCPHCAEEKKITVEIIIKRFQNTHGTKLFDYKFVEYNGFKEKVKIICNNCDKNFWQTPYHHINGNGCPHCAGKTITRDEIIQKFHDKFGTDKFDYSNFVYSGVHQRSEIICLTCDSIFEMTPHEHLTKILGCTKCSGKRKKTLQDIINSSNKLYGVNSFNFSKFKKDIKNAKDKSTIICNVCKNEFNGSWHTHIRRKSGCKNCKFMLNQELCKQIFEILLEKPFITLRINKMKNPETGRNLELDGFCEELNIGFEYNGPTHYIPVYGEENLKTQQIRDKIKYELCIKNNIKLIIIPYTIQCENFYNFIKLMLVENKVKFSNKEINMIELIKETKARKQVHL